VSHWPGFRRRLRGRVAAWSRLELSPDRDPPEPGATAADEWAVYRRYRTVLRGLDAEDAEGFAAWASKSLAASTSPGKLGTVTLLEPDDGSPAVGRALAHFEAKARAVRVTLEFDPDPALAEVSAAAAPLRARLIERGYDETAHGPDVWRPPGLRDVERELFRDDAHTRPPIRDAAGLRVLAAPKGEGVALVVAREVRRHLADGGLAPEDVLVLVRTWDDDADVLLGVLRSWGLPVSGVGRRRGLASEPAVSALRMAVRLPADGWEATEVVKLLRHGRFRPDWVEARPPDALAHAASAVRDAGVYRGKDLILRALDNATAEGRRPTRSRSADAFGLLGRLIAAVEPVDRPGSWPGHVGRLRVLAAELGIEDGGGDEALERLWNALDDHAAVLGGGRVVSGKAFADALDALAAEVADEDDAPHAPGTIAVATVQQAAGARARVVVLANLGEGTFPTRDAAAGKPAVGDPDAADPAFAREMARFLGVFGAADQEVILAYPTHDEKGQEVLAAGFLGDLERRLDGPALAAARVVTRRIDPALLGQEDLAVAPADARVHAVAHACVRHDPEFLARLARDPKHRAALDGAASALLLGVQRHHSREFTQFDGKLDEPAALALAARFGPEAVFSPSQLESFLLCPYQFFMKYVLKVQPVDDRDELDEDFVGRGNLVHKKLEELEQRKLQDGGDRLDLVKMVIQTEMAVELSVSDEPDHGLHLIERRRLVQTLNDYVGQAGKYEAGPVPKGKKKDEPRPEAAPVPHLFEIKFGDPEEGTHPWLQIGEGGHSVRLRGTIDRVDRVDSAGGVGFRVIDYKTGKCPTGKDVAANLMVQLPLYALAVERLGLAGESAVLVDVGYWDLKGKGYRAVQLDEWPAVKERLEAAVLGAVGRLRRGLVVIDPRKDDCAGACDFGPVCRIGSVRSVRKGAGS